MLMKKPVKCSSCNKKIQATAQICQFCKSPRTPQYVPDPHINNQISFILRLIQSETSFEAVAIKLNNSANERIDNRSWTAKDIRDIHEDFVGQFNFKNGKWRPCPLCSEEIAMRVTFCKFCKSRVPKIYTKDPFANKQITKILDFSKSLNDVQIAERLNNEGDLRLDHREWLPSDINELKNQFGNASEQNSQPYTPPPVPYWFKLIFWTLGALALLGLSTLFLTSIFSAADYPRPTKASQSSYNQNIFLATTSKNLSHADLAWHATNTYGWNCSEVVDRSSSYGSYFTITCSNGKKLRVYPRTDQHPRITNLTGDYR
jgi:hypothetical protein